MQGYFQRPLLHFWTLVETVGDDAGTSGVILHLRRSAGRQEIFRVRQKRRFIFSR